jgi:hypothetical protein
VSNETLETWKNQSAGRVVVRKRGEFGVETDEMVSGGKVLHIAATDRRMNQERAATEELDVFTNGMLTPMKLGDSAEEFASNPNLLTEGDMRTIVRSHPKTFEKRLREISNPVVVSKLLEVAREEDCTIKRIESIQAQLEAVSPINTVKIQTHGTNDRETQSFAVTTT